MDCADYCIYCDGDSDSDGNDLLYGVLDKKSVLEFDFQNALSLFCVVTLYENLGITLASCMGKVNADFVSF